MPWSHAGSYLTVAHLSGTDSRPDGLYLRTVRGHTDHQSLLLLEVTRGGRPVKTTEAADATVVRETAGGGVEAGIDEFQSTWAAPERRRPWDGLVAEREREQRAWRAGLPTVPAEYVRTGDVAAFLLWSNRVAPGWLLSRPATFSTKNTLIGDWGWDHCFHALPLADHNPRAAWDEFMVVFDAQDRFGALPDRLNDTVRMFDFTKPPVHGWALRWMMRRNASVCRSSHPICRRI